MIKDMMDDGLGTMLQQAIMIVIVWSWVVTPVGSHPFPFLSSVYALYHMGSSLLYYGHTPPQYCLVSMLCTIWVPYCCTTVIPAV